MSLPIRVGRARHWESVRKMPRHSTDAALKKSEYPQAERAGWPEEPVDFFVFLSESSE